MTWDWNDFASGLVCLIGIFYILTTYFKNEKRADNMRRLMLTPKERQHLLDALKSKTLIYNDLVHEDEAGCDTCKGIARKLRLQAISLEE